MPISSIKQQMPVDSAAVFELLHDYDRRLLWDTLLKKASLTRGHTKAGKGATSLCVGKPFFGCIGIETEYVAFNEGSLAAVRMINKPPFFSEFAASIRHTDTADRSMIVYKLNFKAKPRWLAFLLEPIMLRVLKAETRQRLDALAKYLAED